MLNEMLDDFTSAITSNLSTFSTGAMGLVGVLALIDYGLDVMGHAGENPMSIVKMSVRKILKYTFYIFCTIYMTFLWTNCSMCNDFSQNTHFILP